MQNYNIPMATKAINFKKWIDDNRHLLKPPVGNQVVYVPDQDFIVMVVGGPNARKDFHFNGTEEFFYQLEGDIVVRIIEDGQPVVARHWGNSCYRCIGPRGNKSNL